MGAAEIEERTRPPAAPLSCPLVPGDRQRGRLVSLRQTRRDTLAEPVPINAPRHPLSAKALGTPPPAAGLIRDHLALRQSEASKALLNLFFSC